MPWCAPNHLASQNTSVLPRIAFAEFRIEQRFVRDALVENPALLKIPSSGQPHVPVLIVAKLGDLEALVGRVVREAEPHAHIVCAVGTGKVDALAAQGMNEAGTLGRVLCQFVATGAEAREVLVNRGAPSFDAARPVERRIGSEKAGVRLDV